MKFAIVDESRSNSNLHIREGFWISLLETVSRGINEREESNNIDFQVLTYSKHFQHSKTCLPYMTSKVISTATLQLKNYKQNVLKPRRPTQYATRGTPNCTTAKRIPQGTLNRNTLAAYGFVRRTGTAAE
jgi:hypothetical protein